MHRRTEPIGGKEISINDLVIYTTMSLSFVCEYAFLSLVDLFFSFMIYFFLDATVTLARAIVTP